MPCTTLMEYMLNIGGRREDLEIKNFHIIKIVLERAPALFQHLLYFRFDLMMMLKIDWQCWCGCWQWFMVLCNCFVEFCKSDIAVHKIWRRHLAPSPYWMIPALLEYCVNQHSIDVKIRNSSDLTALRSLLYISIFANLLVNGYQAG